MADNKLLLLDTASLYFRAFYGVPDSIKAPDGTPVNAVRGLLDFIARLVADRSPARLVACLDADWRPQFRVELLPSYKAHRLADGVSHQAAHAAAAGASIDRTHGGAAAWAEDVPGALQVQIPIIIDALDALGLAYVGVPGFEADDVIGTLAVHDAGPVDIVTGDRDLFQLVDDSRSVRVLYTARGVGRHEVMDESAITAKYGIPGRAYADFATLRGDPSDGLPGVPGVGDKTAATLITRFGSLPGLLAAADDPDADLSPNMRRKLAEAHDYLEVAPRVVAVRGDVPLPEYDDTLPSSPADPEAVVALAERWGLDSSFNRVLNALQSATATS